MTRRLEHSVYLEHVRRTLNACQYFIPYNIPLILPYISYFGFPLTKIGEPWYEYLVVKGLPLVIMDFCAGIGVFTNHLKIEHRRNPEKEFTTIFRMDRPIPDQWAIPPLMEHKM